MSDLVLSANIECHYSFERGLTFKVSDSTGWKASFTSLSLLNHALSDRFNNYVFGNVSPY